MSISYPYLAVANKLDIPYSDVLAYVDLLEATSAIYPGHCTIEDAYFFVERTPFGKFNYAVCMAVARAYFSEMQRRLKQ